MRSEKLYDALTEVDETLLPATALSEQRQKKKTGLRWAGAVAALVALAILLTALLRPGGGGGMQACALETAVYPDAVSYPDLTDLVNGESVDEEALGAQLDAWYEASEQKREARKNYSNDDLRSYLTAAIPAYLAGHDGQNAACSPVNLYLALAMLSETTAGETRDQILSLLGAEDMDSLRTVANSIFFANYSNDGASKSLLASAIWLNDKLSYDTGILKRLAQTYYCSSFQGTMGSADYDSLLRQWLNEQTGNQLKEQIGNLSFNNRTVMALTTTVDFAAHWDQNFQEAATVKSVFHAKSGDLPCRMMRCDETGFYYWGEQFGAMDLYFRGGGRMRFLLPDEGVSPEALLQDPEALSFLLEARYSGENYKDLIIHLSLPKFDISSELSLEKTMQNLGLTDVFDPYAADFSPLTGTQNVYLSEVQHGVRVAVDEKGVVASAYTTMMTEYGSAMPPEEEIDFILDRPFVFAIYGLDDLPLFVGIVNQP